MNHSPRIHFVACICLECKKINPWVAVALAGKGTLCVKSECEHFMLVYYGSQSVKIKTTKSRTITVLLHFVKNVFLDAGSSDYSA